MFGFAVLCASLICRSATSSTIVIGLGFAWLGRLRQLDLRGSDHQVKNYSDGREQQQEKKGFGAGAFLAKWEKIFWRRLRWSLRRQARQVVRDRSLMSPQSLHLTCR